MDEKLALLCLYTFIKIPNKFTLTTLMQLTVYLGIYIYSIYKFYLQGTNAI